MKLLSQIFYTIALVLCLGIIIVPIIGILTGYWLLGVTGVQSVFLLAAGAAGYALLGTVFQLLHLEIEYKKKPLQLTPIQKCACNLQKCMVE